MKTFVPSPGDIQRDWWVVDAADKSLGRVASEVASRLRGKHKPYFTPFLDTGDHVIVINAEKVKLTGNKREAKVYYRHSGYPGGIRETTAREMLEKKPARVVELAVRRMLPKNRLGRKMYTKLRVYGGQDHPHQAQRPQPLEIKG